MPRNYTFEEIMALKPCYPPEQLQQYFPPEGTITAEQIVEADDFAHSDKLWVLIRLLTPADFVTFACDCAERVLHILPDSDEPRKIIAAARSGYKDAAIEAAAAYAYATAHPARATAVVDAAAAAYAAAVVDAAAAARAASAADAATYAAHAEKKWQLERLLQLIHAAEEAGNQPF